MKYFVHRRNEWVFYMLSGRDKSSQQLQYPQEWLGGITELDDFDQDAEVLDECGPECQLPEESVIFIDLPGRQLEQLLNHSEDSTLFADLLWVQWLKEGTLNQLVQLLELHVEETLDRIKFDLHIR